jgi:hypothetical protein
MDGALAEVPGSDGDEASAGAAATGEVPAGLELILYADGGKFSAWNDE